MLIPSLPPYERVIEKKVSTEKLSQSGAWEPAKNIIWMPRYSHTWSWKDLAIEISQWRQPITFLLGFFCVSVACNQDIPDCREFAHTATTLWFLEQELIIQKNQTFYILGPDNIWTNLIIVPGCPSGFLWEGVHRAHLFFPMEFMSLQVSRFTPVQRQV